MNGFIIHSHEVSPYWIQILEEAKNECFLPDVIALHPVGGKEASDALEKLIEQVKTDEFKNFAKDLDKLGVKLEYEMHTLSWLIPRDIFDKHPEYFRMNKDGVRTPDANICASSEECLSLLEERSAYLASLLPQSTDRYFYWIDDIEDAFCHCEKCKEFSSSDQALKIINRIQRGIRRVNPNAKLCYLAYRNTLPPPTKIKPDEGIFLEYAPITRDLTRPMKDSADENNREKILRLLDFFGKENSQVLEYWMDNSLNCKWKLPYKKLPFYPNVIKADVKFYRSLGFENLTSFACFLGEDYAKEFGKAPMDKYFKILKGEIL